MENVANMVNWKEKQALVMYTAYDLMELMGISYAAALALTKKHGIRIGRSYRIRRDRLHEVLNGGGRSE